VTHGKNSQKDFKDPRFTSMFVNETPQGQQNAAPGVVSRPRVGGPTRPNTMGGVTPMNNQLPSAQKPKGIMRPTTTAGAFDPNSTQPRRMNGAWAGQGDDLGGVNGTPMNNNPANPSYSKRPNTSGVVRGGPQYPNGRPAMATSSFVPPGVQNGQNPAINPMFGNRTRNVANNQPDIVIDDKEFEYPEGSDPYKETLFEQNVYQVLHDHRDCMKPNCLEVKPPVVKKSVYTQDYPEFPIDPAEPCQKAPPFKPKLPIDTDTTYRVISVLSRLNTNL
jgi:hypothetical protein